MRGWGDGEQLLLVCNEECTDFTELQRDAHTRLSDTIQCDEKKGDEWQRWCIKAIFFKEHVKSTGGQRSN